MLTRLVLLLTRVCLCGGIVISIAHAAETGENQPQAMQAVTSGEQKALESDGPETGAKEKKEFGELEYRLIGPAVGGRITAVAGVPGDPLVFHASAAQGGLWKSVDGGHEWEPLFDDQSSQSIGSCAPVTAEEIRQNVDFSLALRDAFNAVVDEIAEIRAIRTQVADLRARLADRPQTAGIRASADRVLAACDTIEHTLHNPDAQVAYDILAGRDGGAKLYSQLAFLFDANDASDYPPAQGLRERYDELAAELRQRQDELAALRQGDLAQLEREVAATGLPRVILPP